MPPHALEALVCAAQGDELAPRMRDALQKGKLGISALSPRVTTGKEQWQEWHHDFFHNQMEDAIQAVSGHSTPPQTRWTPIWMVITLRESQQTALVGSAEGLQSTGTLL